MFTNINIKDADNTYNYIVEYKNGGPTDNKVVNYTDSIVYNDKLLANDISLWYEGASYIKYINRWLPAGDINTHELSDGYSISYITVYFPDFSIDRIHGYTDYALDVNIWIGGRKVNIGSYIINRKDALACDTIKVFGGQRYYECIELPIFNPYEISYSDKWNSFRGLITNSIHNSRITNQHSIINVSLYPVIKTNNEYRVHDDYVGGHNAMPLSKKDDSNLRLNIRSNTKDSLNKEQPAIVCSLEFNEYYDSLSAYIQDIYNVSNYTVKYEMVIGNNDTLYDIFESGEVENELEYKFTKEQILSHNNFVNGIGWRPGVFIKCTAIISMVDNNSEASIMSNTLMFNEDLFRYFVGPSDFMVNRNPVYCVNLDLLDMNVLNINTVNKIENKVVQFSSPVDTKSNLIQPTFFRTTELANIVIHPEVVETICINLDRYKSKVDHFVMQVEGVKFVEIGRNSNGSLFKIIGANLPNVKTSGTYYILNQDNELVTSGKYTYDL